MSTTDIVIVTILTIIGIVAVFSLLKRMIEVADNLWVEPVIIAVSLLLIYLIAR